MKETNVWLSPEELKHMLKGSMQWIDVASRAATSEKGIRKLSGGTTSEKQSAPRQDVNPADYSPKVTDKPIKQLEGQPVIWLLGSIGLLTLSSWFYYVFTK